METVRLVNVDSLIPNVALMKLSAWRKSLGDDVAIYNPLVDKPDIIYASKVFHFTDDFPYYPEGCEIERGGTGYAATVRLCSEAESIYPDYDLFGCSYAIGRITRGCPRGCPWCVVPKMDGLKVHQVAELSDFHRGQERVRLLDDNLTADRGLFISTCHQLSEARVQTKFEALDIRFIDIDAARALAQVKRWGQVHFAFDSLIAESGVRRGVKALKDGGFPLRAATFYVLIGFDTTPEQDMYRIQLLNELGVESFAMPFDKTDPYQKAFTRWVNHKAVFRSCSFTEYRSNTKGHMKHDMSELFAIAHRKEEA